MWLGAHGHGAVAADPLLQDGLSERRLSAEEVEVQLGHLERLVRPMRYLVDRRELSVKRAALYDMLGDGRPVTAHFERLLACENSLPREFDFVGNEVEAVLDAAARGDTRFAPKDYEISSLRVQIVQGVEAVLQRDELDNPMRSSIFRKTATSLLAYQVASNQLHHYVTESPIELYGTVHLLGPLGIPQSKSALMKSYDWTEILYERSPGRRRLELSVPDGKRAARTLFEQDVSTGDILAVARVDARRTMQLVSRFEDVPATGAMPRTIRSVVFEAHDISFREFKLSAVSESVMSQDTLIPVAEDAFLVELSPDERALRIGANRADWPDEVLRSISAEGPVRASPQSSSPTPAGRSRLDPSTTSAAWTLAAVLAFLIGITALLARRRKSEPQDPR